MELQVKKLKRKIDQLQKQHGHPDYTALYGTGCINRPNVCLIFMNPTARNISVQKSWTGLKASWLGTKNIWKLLYQLEFINKQTFDITQQKKPHEWDKEFCNNMYTTLAKKKVFITNLARSTQPDARPLHNSVFAACVPIMKEEIAAIKPRVIISFGNQVSSILLGQPIKVSETRKKLFTLKVGKGSYPVYPTYYPVGMGLMNMGKAVEDIKWILKKHKVSSK